MNYEKAYNQLINVVMDEIDNVSVETAEKVQVIHSLTTDNPRSNEQGITADQWKQMTSTERVDFKAQNPETYDNALRGNFSKGE